MDGTGRQARSGWQRGRAFADGGKLNGKDNTTGIKESHILMVFTIKTDCLVEMSMNSTCKRRMVCLQDRITDGKDAILGRRLLSTVQCP